MREAAMDMREAPMEKSDSLSALLDFAKDVARRAGDSITSSVLSPEQVSSKGDHEFVTEVDFLSQALIVDSIRCRHPNHGFLVEESSPDIPSPQQYTWVVDPIDGTLNYIRARPFYCVSLGLLIDNAPRLGVIYDPIHKEMFAAASGHGFYLNDRPFDATARINRLYDAAVGMDWDTSSVLRGKAMETMGRAIPLQTVPIMGFVALALAWIALGRIDAYFNFAADKWDISDRCGND